MFIISPALSGDTGWMLPGETVTMITLDVIYLKDTLYQIAG